MHTCTHAGAHTHTQTQTGRRTDRHDYSIVVRGLKRRNVTCDATYTFINEYLAMLA